MFFALTLLGCTAWIDQEPACDQDIYYWSDDLLAFVLTGDGSGAFEFDPEDAPRTEVSGEYHPDDGDFDWNAKYDEGYYLRKAESEGFGTVFHNGNLDLLFTETVTDMLGDVVSTAYRVQRTGCDMTVATWDAEDGSAESALVMAGSYEDDSVWSWSVDYPGYTWTGSLRKNLIRTSQIDAEDGSYYAFTTVKPEGETTQEWEGACSDYYCEGTTTRLFDGKRVEQYTAFDGDDVFAEVEGEFDYDNSGTETIRYADGPECEFTYESDGDCTYTCDDGDDGDCSA